MVCYARPASRLVAIVFVAWLVFAVPASHFLSTAALATAVLVAAVGAAVAAAVAVATFTSVKRRRAAAGGCVTCQFRCQQAMTEPARRLRLVTTTDRRPPGSTAGHPGVAGRPDLTAARSVSVRLPMPTVRSATAAPATAAPATAASLPVDLAAPRWPDRPAYRAGPASHRVPAAAAHVAPRERVGSPALAGP